MNIDIVQILCIGGKQLWEESDSSCIEQDILTPNDIYVKNIVQKRLKDDTFIFCEVDTTKTKLNDFYNWNDIPLTDSETFVWRTFYDVRDKEENMWLRIPKSEKLGNIRISKLLNEILQK